MRRQCMSWMVSILGRSQIVASLDPEVLQWPGGSLIATFLWISMTAHRFARSAPAILRHKNPWPW